MAWGLVKHRYSHYDLRKDLKLPEFVFITHLLTIFMKYLMILQNSVTGYPWLSIRQVTDWALEMFVFASWRCLAILNFENGNFFLDLNGTGTGFLVAYGRDMGQNVIFFFFEQ